MSIMDQCIHYPPPTLSSLMQEDTHKAPKSAGVILIVIYRKMQLIPSMRLVDHNVLIHHAFVYPDWSIMNH